MEKKIITIEQGKEQYGPVIAMLQWYNDILVGNAYWQNICARHVIASADTEMKMFSSIEKLRDTDKLYYHKKRMYCKNYDRNVYFWLVIKWLKNKNPSLCEQGGSHLARFLSTWHRKSVKIIQTKVLFCNKEAWNISLLGDVSWSSWTILPKWSG